MKTKKNILLGISLFLLVLVSCTTSNKEKKEIKAVTLPETIIKKPEQTSANPTAKETKLKSSEVCYVNNAFMRSEQIPVVVDGKTYYGCCEGCVSKLKNNLNGVRFDVDPLTGEKVDKATAYIVLKPNSNSDVLYFASEKNYNEFIKKL